MAYSKNWIRNGSAAAVAATLMLAACGNTPSSTNEAETAPTSEISNEQIFAIVGGEELPVSLIESILRAENQPLTEATVARLQEELIAQTALRQKALEMRLDRSPEVLTQLMMARNQILARAVMADFRPEDPEVSDVEIDLYLSDNESLFEERTHYFFNAFDVPNQQLDPARHDALEEMGDLDTVIGQLKSEGMEVIPRPFSAQDTALPEQMRLQLPALAATGEVFFVINGPVTRVMSVEQQIKTPLTDDQKRQIARTSIETRLRRQQIADYRQSILDGAGVVRNEIKLEPVQAPETGETEPAADDAPDASQEDTADKTGQE